MAPSTLVRKNGLRFKAMRTALKTDPDWQRHESGAPALPLGVMDSFASLRTVTSSSYTLGGYRVLRPAGAAARVRTPRALLPKLGQVLRGVGLLGGLVAASLCVGAFAGPDAPATITAAQNELRLAAQTKEPSAVLAAMIADPEDAKQDSAIATSAIAPAEQPAQAASAAQSIGEALPEKIEALADAPPQPIRLAEAPTPDELSSVAPDPVTAAPVEEAAPAKEAVEKPIARPAAHTSPKPAHRHLRHVRTSTRHARTGAATADAQDVQRAPLWAQQMYATPWQSKAFSYFR